MVLLDTRVPLVAQDQPRMLISLQLQQHHLSSLLLYKARPLQ